MFFFFFPYCLCVNSFLLSNSCHLARQFSPACCTCHPSFCLSKSLKIQLLCLTLALYANSCRFLCAQRWPIQDHRYPAHSPLPLDHPVLLFPISYLLPWLCPVQCHQCHLWDPKTSLWNPILTPHSSYYSSLFLLSLTRKFSNIMDFSDAFMPRSPHYPTAPWLSSWSFWILSWKYFSPFTLLIFYLCDHIWTWFYQTICHVHEPMEVNMLEQIS